MTGTSNAIRPAPPPSKWVPGVSAGQPVRESAAQILRVRLQAVWYWLPLAAEKSDEDPEYVHQLRISSRRAVEAVRLFSNLVERAGCRDFRERLRQIRRAADAARNWDVLAARFIGHPGILDAIRREVRKQRAEAQVAVVSVDREMPCRAFEQQIEELAEAVRKQTRKKALRTLGEQAPQYLNKAWRRFFRAAVANLSDDDRLHELRIEAKKLRYTMEPLSPAFEPAFREGLYPQITFLQDFLGRINDHAMARALLTEWHSRTRVAAEKAFLTGMLAAEERAHDDLRQTFLAYWTRDNIAALSKQFRKYCRRGRPPRGKTASKS